MKVQRSVNMTHPILSKCIHIIQNKIIDAHNMPIRLFETGRDRERHQMLLTKGKTKDLVSRHLYKLDNDPPLYATAVDYVYFDNRWSWNFRDSTINSWYLLFGNLVLDTCPELQWSAMNRKATNFCHFEVKRSVLMDNMKHIPCVT